MATVNGVPYDFTCIDLTAYNFNINAGLQSVSYGQTMEVQEIGGTAAASYDFTPGTLTTENMEIELLEWCANEFRRKLGSGYMTKKWPCTIGYKFDGNPLTKDTLEGCRIVGEKKSPKKGADALVTTFTVKVLRIMMDGLSPV
jgi:type IV secretory pathway component VirB8